MKKLFLITALLLSFFVGRAQDFAGQARHIVDSLLQIWENDSTNVLSIPENDKFYFARLEDSLTGVFVLAHLDTTLSKGEYSWPSWYLRNDWEQNPSQDTGIRFPSATQQQLMKSKYGLSMDGPLNGCLWQRPFVIHDSLMMAAIRKRYGFDFFQRLAAEADSLDSAGAGLRLPYIGSPGATNAVLRQALRRLVSATETLGEDGKQRCRDIYFKDGEPIHAMLLRNASYAMFMDSEFKDEAPYVHEIVQTLDWTPPMFLNRPVDRNILWNVATGEFRWR